MGQDGEGLIFFLETEQKMSIATIKKKQKREDSPVRMHFCLPCCLQMVSVGIRSFHRNPGKKSQVDACFLCSLVGNKGPKASLIQQAHFNLVITTVQYNV